MGAMIAYLHYEKGVKNFFVMAPNLTIYKKLKNDLGNQAHEKYVFHGLDKCEYGADNYNLNIISPPELDEDEWEDYEDA